ncbi:MAG: SDR family NAD(P)-dependent oxidoreductase [Asgard group archaeon]|nr:SDR family NAD(P)-dependent oxidoreductase [Asgard group archaeon]
MSLKGKVALVTGASRGAGRGIAYELAIAGVKVYITGRSRDGESTTQYEDLTLDQTVKMIEKSDGVAIPITCDHEYAKQIKEVFNKIKSENDKLDILVNNIWGGYMGEYGNLDIETSSFTAPFWDQPLWRFERMFFVAARAHFVGSQYAAQIMKEDRSGLIVTTSFWDNDKYISNLPYDLVKVFKNRMSLGMAIDLKPYNVTTLTLGLGWIRTEHLKRLHDLDDFNYKQKKGFEKTESTRYAGRAIVALASDPNIIRHTGKIFTTAELARMYLFTDLDGSQPEFFSVDDKSDGIKQR